MKKKLKALAGFTLAELLIVVAIIAVLVAISIPIFTSRLEASRESTDAANLRSAYAAAATALLMGKDDNGDPLTFTNNLVTCYYSKQGKLVSGAPGNDKPAAMLGKSTIDKWQGSTIDDLPEGVFLQCVSDTDDLDTDANDIGNSQKGAIYMQLSDDPTAAEVDSEIIVYFYKAATAGG